jgi:ATP-dependent Clp protease ATP-binding subunit ClpC
MFERYTEKTNRVMFFARYEANQFGSPYVETEHILLGVLREDKTLSKRFLSPGSAESIRRQIEGHTTIREKNSQKHDPPLSNESKRVVAYAAEEAEQLNDKYINTEHIWLGLLREEKSFAAEILHERGVRLSATREVLKRIRQEKAVSRRVERNASSDFILTISSDLTPDQIKSTLHALADYYRACGGVGFEIDFQLEDILVGEPVSV